MDLIRFVFKTLRSSFFLICLLLAGYLAQSFATQAHFAHHSVAKLVASHDTHAGISAENCLICDNAQITPKSTSIFSAVELAERIEAAPPIAPIFCSDNPILRPFGARAPPLT